MVRTLFVFILMIGLVTGTGMKEKLTLTSPVYEEGGMIPAKYTCDAENVSPPLQWSNVPDSTKSFALIFDDPDAPGKTWIHWVMYNIPGDQRSLEENVPAEKVLDNGAIHGINDFKTLAYGGPCPPSGTHRYMMKLYALDTKLDLDPGATKQQVLDAMEGHVVQKAVLTGKYKRQ